MPSSLKKEEPRIPAQTRTALYLLGLAFALGLVHTIIVINRGLQGIGATVLLIAALLMGSWIYGLSRGVNWLRWLTVWFAVLGLIGLSRSLASAPDPTTLAMVVAQYLFFDVGAILLCLRDSKTFFTNDDA